MQGYLDVPASEKFRRPHKLEYMKDPVTPYGIDFKLHPSAVRKTAK